VGLLRRSVVAIVLFVALAPACNFGKDLFQTPATPPPPNSAKIELTITPSPVTVTVACPAPSNPAFCLASLNPTVTVAETAGLGGRIESVEVVLRNVTLNRDETKISLGSDWVARQAGTNRLEAKARIGFQPVVSGYPILAEGPRPLLRIVLSVQFVDDKSNTLFPSIQSDLAWQ
jgi:hypothetical protein